MGFSIDAKRIFIGFAQKLFAENYALTWTLDPKTTGILIGDKHFIESPLIEMKPAIIVSRGPLRWGQHTIDQRMSYSLANLDKKFSDIIYGTIVYNVLSQNEFITERLADYLFTKLTGYRDQFRRNGINNIINIAMGDTVLLKNNTEVEFINVPISVNYAMQRNIDLVHDTFSSMYITSEALDIENVDGAELGAGITGTYGKGLYIQGIDYTISGSDIHFITIPSGVKLTFVYTGSTTLSTYSEEIIVPTNNPLLSYDLIEPVDYIYPLYSGIIIYDQLYSGISN
ncbi:hypothetical protein AYK24_00340 [Thermoplasmatales archaeon SG8-52-4]|nr:MAG: hypothetical protein AYK24_00340 [Thermoplasmatales archaeon SG8-52-4]